MSKKYKIMRVDPEFDRFLDNFTQEMRERSGKKISKIRSTSILAYLWDKRDLETQNIEQEMKRKRRANYSWE